MNATAQIVHALVAGKNPETPTNLSLVEQAALHELLTLLQAEPRDITPELANANGWTIGVTEDQY